MFFSITHPCFSAYGRPNIHWQVRFQTAAWKLTIWKCFCKADVICCKVETPTRVCLAVLLKSRSCPVELVKVRQTLSIVYDSLDIPNGLLLDVENFLCPVYAFPSIGDIKEGQFLLFCKSKKHPVSSATSYKRRFAEALPNSQLQVIFLTFHCSILHICSNYCSSSISEINSIGVSLYI
jgi:hypothetical protein